MILVLTPYLQIHRKSKESKEIDFAIPHWFAYFFPHRHTEKWTDVSK